jgi:signal transduction histidine kinase
MGRLFWKIFGLLLLTGAMVIAGGFYLFNQLQEQGLGDRLANHVMGKIAAEAVAVFEEGGEDGFRQWLREQRHAGRRGRITLEIPDGRQLPRPLRPRLSAHLREDRVFFHPGDNPAGPFFINKLTLTGENTGETFRVIAVYSSPATFLGPRMPLMSLPLLALMIGSGLLAWVLTRPLRQLKSATHRFAQGDLEARTPGKVHRRKDAIGDLAREHDRMAERIANLVGAQRQLVRDVSHELRSPLARMAVAATLAESANGAEREDAAERIQTEIRRMDALIDDLLTLSRVESGVEAFEFEDCNLRTLVEDIAADAAFEFDTRNIRISATGDTTVRADCRRLRHALENILRNALRHSPEPSVVCITLDADDLRVGIEVADDGPGVEPDQLGRIFEPFFRGDGARAPDDGHGVGLAIARAMVAGHHGNIHAVNRLNGGLAICVELPRNPHRQD